MTFSPITRAEAGLIPRYRGVDLVLNLEEWQRLSGELDLLTDQDWARQLGVEATSVWRMRTGRQGLSSRMIAALFDLLPADVGLRDLFHITKVGDPR